MTLVERLHRRLLDVIKDEFDRRGRSDINSVQALLLYNIGDKELTAGELRTRGYYLGSNVSYNLKKLVEMGFLDHQRSRVDRRSVRIRLTDKGREVRDIVDAPLPEARAHGRAGRRHHRRRVRRAQQVAASARAVLDRPDPLSALRPIGRGAAELIRRARPRRRSPAAVLSATALRAVPAFLEPRPSARRASIAVSVTPRPPLTGCCPFRAVS